MQVLNETRSPIKSWCPLAEIEPQAIEQLKRIAAMPFIFKHVAVMPDVHLGKGATVGSVIASKNAIMPAAVGVDLGCGMIASRLNSLSLTEIQDRSEDVFKMIEELVPVGREGNKDFLYDAGVWDGWKLNLQLSAPFDLNRAKLQLGSLGGGNHFIEICADTLGYAWLVIHSGSRNVGKVVADYHINEAKRLMEWYHIALEDQDLAYLPTKSEEFKSYTKDLFWCQEYAKANRRIMFDRILHGLWKMFDPSNIHLLKFINEPIDCHHNYAMCEHHFGENVWVTRKGAVRARVGDYGIIPGSMGTRSYIVKGLGNPQSFDSCSHGAGRVMSRTEAKRKFTKDDLSAQTMGVVCRKDDGIVDEIPGAYKDIDQVMENQKDLVEIVAELKQFICVKG